MRIIYVYNNTNSLGSGFNSETIQVIFFHKPCDRSELGGSIMFNASARTQSVESLYLSMKMYQYIF